MSVKPRTIDNLGVDASIRYARDQEFFEAKLIEESRLIPLRTEVSVAKPYVLSEFDQMFSLGKTISWALFSPPPNYYSYDKRFFSYQLIPSLGDYEKLEADSDRIESLEDVLQKTYEGMAQQGSSDAEREQEEKERKILSALFRCIDKLTKVLYLVNSRRNQYQKG